ncbi:MAG TPA: peptidase M28, partial [Thermoanaerobaculia bacterium]|nr:peptidase M28 [Thermoanaerobaculia bacterium]
MKHAIIRTALLGLALALLAALPAVLTAQTSSPLHLPAGAEQAAKAIDRAALEGPIRFLSDDLLEGRGPGSRGDELTQAYLATTMEFLGLKPGAQDGKWLQPFEIVGINATMPETWEFQAGGKTVSLKRSDEFIAASGVQEPAANLRNAELVFVGYGIDAPEHQWNDFKGMDLKGKVLVMLNNDPDWDDKLFEGKRRLYYGRWTYKYESAARQGAAGAIIIHTVPSAGYPWQVVQTSWSRERFELPYAGEPRVTIKGWITEEKAKAIAALSGKDLDALRAAAQKKNFRPVPLGATVSIEVTNVIQKKESANVVGRLEGSDP